MVNRASRALKCLVVILLVTSSSSKEDEDAVITDLFDALLFKDGIQLSGVTYTFRLANFAANYLAMPEDGVANLDFMYTEHEEAMRNGAHLESNVTSDPELQKREELLLASVRAPPFYDTRYMQPMNAAVNQMTCGNCYLHVFVAALEIAYTRFNNGDLVKFSEQEMTDCYYRGCNGGDYRMVSVLMTYLDKLSEKSSYGPYMDGVYTCRADSTPDALDNIKAVQYMEVTTDNIEESIVSYGSVMTCMAWATEETDPCYFKNYVAGEVIREPEVIGGCDHAVLIVGYTSQYYIVRNSHGTTFGDEGYFLIERNTNSCGIEEDMAALVVEARQGTKPGLATNGCPEDIPTLCDDIHTCTPESQACVEPINRAVLEEREAGRGKGKNKNQIDDWELPGQRSQLQTREVAEIVLEKRCVDSMTQCIHMGNHCGIIAAMCPLTCGDCSEEIEEESLPPNTEETVGNCYKPEIANGQVINAEDLLDYGEALSVLCNTGYELVGETDTCLIQNVFSNTDTDSRLMQECVESNGEVLVGNGTDYHGTVSEFTIANTPVTCDNWNVAVLKGSYMGDYEAYKLLEGNHNFCRNPSGEHPVPMCLQGEPALGYYCFDYPGCEVCDAVQDADTSGAACPSARCKYSTLTSRNTVDYWWTYCKRTCCETAGCY